MRRERRRIERTPEDRAKLAEARYEARRQRQGAERVAVLYRMLMDLGHIGVVAKDSANVPDMLDALEASHPDTKVLRLDAQGAIQGKDRGAEWGVEHLENIRQAFPGATKRLGILAYTGFNFNEGVATYGTRIVASSVKDITTPRDRRDISSSALLIVGVGDPANCDAHPMFRNIPRHPIMENIVTPFILNHDGSLAPPSIDPAETYSVRTGIAPALRPIPPTE
jgi:hypothetical protein